mgnify:CR=1 FL=1
MERKWIYFGVFLVKESRNKLQKLASKVVLDNWKLYCHHMTIAFNNGSEQSTELYEFYKNYFGARTEIIATHIGISDDAVAVKVQFNGETLNKTPHVTLATPIGGKPVNSNNIQTWARLKQPIKLIGIFSEFKK